MCVDTRELLEPLIDLAKLPCEPFLENLDLEITRRYRNCFFGLLKDLIVDDGFDSRLARDGRP